MSGSRPRAKHCFECGDKFTGDTVDAIFSEDRQGNAYCKSCTIKAWGGRDNFEDTVVERVWSFSGSIVRITAPNEPTYEE